MRAYQPVIMSTVRFAIISDERPARYAIRSVSLIAKIVHRIAARSFARGLHPSTPPVFSSFCAIGARERGSPGRPLISTVSGPVLDTMGPRHAPSFSRLGVSSSPSRPPQAGCVLYAWESRARAQSLGPRDGPQRAPSGPIAATSLAPFPLSRQTTAG